MWLVNAVLGGFSTPVPLASLALFRILFGLSLLLKFLVETRRRYYRYLDPGAYLAFRFAVAHKGREVPAPLWRFFHWVRIPAAAMVVLGFYIKIGLVIVALALALEMLVYFKYHANYMWLVCLALIVSPGSDCSLRDALSGAVKAPPVAHALVVATLYAMYLSTALHKMNPTFLSGRVVMEQLKAVIRQRETRHHWDTFVPNFAAKWIKNQNTGKSSRFVRGGMVTTVSLEVLLPLLLLNDYTIWFAMAAGIVMHGAFTLLFPATLLHFSLVVVASYLLLIPPELVARLLEG